MSLINVDYPDNSLGSQQQANQHQAQAKTKRALAYNLDLFELIRRKFKLINFFVLLGIAIAMVYYFKAPKLYKSIAGIHVDEQNAPSMNNNESDMFKQEAPIERYLLTLKSNKILEPAVEIGQFDKFECFEDTEDIVRYLRESKDAFVAKPADVKSSSGFIQLSFEGPNRDECAKVLDAIIESFDRHIKETTDYIGGESTNLFSEWYDKSSNQLKQVETRVQELMSRPELLMVEGRVVNPHQMQLGLMQNDLHDLRRERTKIKARIATVKKDQAEGKDLSNLIIEMIRESGDQSFGAYVATHDQYIQLKVKEQELLSQFGGDHPDLKNVRSQIEVVDRMRMQELASLRANKGPGAVTDPDIEQQQDTIVADFIESMSHKIDLLDSEENSLIESITEEQKKSSSVSVLVEELSALTRERERLEIACAALLERVNQIDVYKKHLWRTVRVMNDPSAAEQSAPSLPISLAGGIFLGSLAGLFFAGVKDMAEKTFHSVDEIGEFLDSRVLGHVTKFSRLRPIKKGSAHAKVQPEIVALHQPASQWAESYRSIRTSIFFQAQETGTKVIQVSSPVPGDGKSTTISNLAVSIAQSGRRVLLIDCDMRKPVQHKLFGLDNSFGISSVIMGEKEPDEVLQVVQSEYLSVVTSGPIPMNPAELLTSARYAAVMEHFQEQYDFVLIDTPPILAVTDPSIVAGHVDMMLLVMRIRNGVRTDSVRAKEIIDSTGVTLGGVVINGLRRKDQKTYNYSGQYGYKTYGYVEEQGRRSQRAS